MAPEPYFDKNNILIIETGNILDLLKSIVTTNKSMLAYIDSLKEHASQYSSYFLNANNDEFDKFINDKQFRLIIIKEAMSMDDIVIQPFITFLQNCFDRIKEKAQVKNAFEAYDLGLKVILDILLHKSIYELQPMLIEYTASFFDYIAYYIGDRRGDSHAAYKTWNSIKPKLPLEFLEELLSYAKIKKLLYLKKLIEATIYFRSDVFNAF